MSAVIEVGEKVHIIARRLFKEDVRRHFAGVVTAVASDLIRAEGYSFVAALSGMEFTRLAGLRTRVFGLFDTGYILNVFPPQVVIDHLSYNSRTGSLVITDGSSFSLDVNEFR